MDQISILILSLIVAIVILLAYLLSRISNIYNMITTYKKTTDKLIISTRSGMGTTNI